MASEREPELTHEQLVSIGQNLCPEIQGQIDRGGLHGRVSAQVTEQQTNRAVTNRLVVCIDLLEGELLAEASSLVSRVANQVAAVPTSELNCLEFEYSIPSTELSPSVSDYVQYTFRVRIKADLPRVLKYKDDAPEGQDFRTMPIATLLLSGGGYRATAFHLGVLRWLFEHSSTQDGMSGLEQVSQLVGVSGGSITAAHFTIKRKQYLRDFGPARDLIKFLMDTDLRTNALRDGLLIEDQLFPLLGDAVLPDGECKLYILGTSLKTGDCVVFRTQLSERSRS